MTAIQIGIVGLGAQMQENLLPTLLQMPDVRIVGVCDITTPRAAQIHRFLSDVPVASSVDELFTLAAPDALVLACPPQAHRDIALQAMRAGIHVFVEKPPCFTLDELEALVLANRQSGVITGVGMNFKFAKPIRQLRNMTRAAPFGRTLHVQLNHYASKPREPLWGLNSTLRSFLLAQAIHTIDLGITFGDGKLTDIRSRVQRYDDSLIVNAELVFSSGTTASLLCGTMFPYFEFDMKIVSSTSMMVELDNLWNITVHEPEHGTRAAGTAKRWRGVWQPGPLDSGYERSGYYGELFEFFEAVRKRETFSANFESLLPTYRVIEQICAVDSQNIGVAQNFALPTLHATSTTNPGVVSNAL
ncbi:Gfo/Idh/MocA family oxidoreductase (plasmid) [Mycetohabitans rhizoxinica]|uniref:Gfo/Idh/MocA family oxidoreductase n=1 Tax=Mycetohabitans rhizoxinica TaxID=412963 RepID=A0ABZ2PT28_9BURK|nr:Gfo/Idh/MocA family oxidoreductase [Mycetohabitans sp. B2]MCF7697389.1 Gfo/Idh/MocA family oxidoreductase [Mycetohabitans sp. B2]